MSRPRSPMNNPANAGRASLEFLSVGIVLFVPLMWGAITLLEIQKASMAADAAARHAVRVFTSSTSLEAARQRVQRAVGETLTEFDVSAVHHIIVECEPRSQCLSPGSWALLTVSAEVPLSGIPALPVSTPWAVPVQGSAAAQVSVYRGIP